MGTFTLFCPSRRPSNIYIQLHIRLSHPSNPFAISGRHETHCCLLRRYVHSSDITKLTGTGQDADGETLQSPSNVCLLSRTVKPVGTKKIGVDGEPLDDDNVDQIVYYQAGVGTKFGRITKLLGDATGAGLKQNVREAYGFICHNWRVGDEIYLFGFSRGAYT